MHHTLKTLGLFLFIFALGVSARAQQPQVILHLNWGNENENVGFRKAPEAYYGPQAFQVIDRSVWVLDSPHNALKKFRQGMFKQKITAPPFADDFYLNSINDFTVLSENTVYFFKNKNLSAVYKPQSDLDIIEALQPLDQENLLLHFTDGQYHVFNSAVQRAFPLKKKSSEPNSKIVRPLRKDVATAEIQLGDSSSFTVHFARNNLASVRFLGKDTQGRLYLNFEFFEQQVPLRISRQIIVFNSNGIKLLTLNVPVNNYTKIFRDFYIGTDENFYQMRSGKSGIDIVRWNLKSLFNAQNPPVLNYPQSFQKGRQYNWLIQPDSTKGHHLNKVQSFDDYPQVIPDDALSTGRSYEELYWTCSADNLTNGVVYDDNGYPVRTPSWIVVGQNKKVPYKWGGFNNIEMYLYGIDILKYAGDNYTNKCCGSDAAVGVDCSGFVSRCWNLPKHYSTSMMDDGLTLPYLNWSEMEPADAVHKVGHVRLMVKQNGNGSLTVLEASGKDWRVSYRTYYYSDLSAYTPRYYVNRQGAPDNIPQPRLDLVTSTDQTNVTWDVGGLENIATLRIYKSTDGANWTSSDISKDSLHFSQPIANGKAFYYRLSSLSSESQTEGVPSDAYGVFRNDERVKILIVDGFDRTSATNGKWTKIYHTFAVTFGRALEQTNIPFETVSNDAVLAHQVYLGDYPAVFWILGDESTHDGTFNSNEQDLVKDYLQNGGMLFVSGSEIGWDLSANGTRYDHDFYNDYLKAEYVTDDAATYTSKGQSGSPFDGLTIHFDDGTHGTYNVAYPDVIKPVNGSSVAFNYDNGGAAGIYFEGVFSSGTKKGKLVYLAFPFETVYNESERNALMDKIVEFFGLDHLSAIKGNAGITPNRFKLIGNAPNPFNSSTIIHFQIPAAGNVELQIFNVLGQNILSKSFQYSAPGKQKILFNGQNLTSGLYLYRLTFKDKKQTEQTQGKMLLVK